MFAYVDESSAEYRAGYITAQVVIVGGLIAVVVWAIWSSRRRGAQATMRTPRGDMASLATVLVLQMAHDAAAALVSRVLAGHPQLVPVPGPVPAWSFSGRHPYLTLVQSPGGAVLRVQEVELPLLSPEPVLAWEWAAASVEQEALRLGVPTARGFQNLVQSRAAGPATAIWAAVG